MTTRESYIMEIRCNATGEVREKSYPYGPWDEGQEFWWTEGNFGCDCNRKMEFERVGGTEPLEFEECDFPCGTGAYSVRLKRTEEWL